MIKVCIFNKSNDVSRFDIFKKFFECVNSEISLMCCTNFNRLMFHGVTQKITSAQFFLRHGVYSTNEM